MADIFDDNNFKPLSIGDVVAIVVDLQLIERTKNRYGDFGVVVAIYDDCGWNYRVRFADGGTNLFKRWHLKRVRR